MELKIVGSHVPVKTSLSFKRFSPEVKNIIKRGDIIKSLQSRGITLRDIKLLENSPLKISLLAEDTYDPELSQIAGIIVTAPKKDSLSKMFIPKLTNNPTDTNPNSFTYCFKKVKDLVNSYNYLKRKTSAHKQRKLKAFEIEILDRQTKAALSKVKNGAIDGDADEILLNINTETAKKQKEISKIRKESGNTFKQLFQNKIEQLGIKKYVA